MFFHSKRLGVRCQLTVKYTNNSKIESRFAPYMEIVETYFGPIPAGAMEALEARYRVKLPADYVEFLKVYNGVIPKVNKFFISDKQGNSLLGILYGLPDTTQYEHLGLRINWRDTRDSMPEDIFPIGDDPGGNNVCMCLEGENYGKIYFYDHEEPNEDEKGRLNHDNLYPLAVSFSHFITSLH